jgi:hypothetical protein
MISSSVGSLEIYGYRNGCKAVLPITSYFVYEKYDKYD